MADQTDKWPGIVETSDPAKAPWYQHDIESVLQPRTREMLTQYAGVSPEKLVEHIKLAVRHSESESISCKTT